MLQSCFCWINWFYWSWLQFVFSNLSTGVGTRKGLKWKFRIVSFIPSYVSGNLYHWIGWLKIHTYIFVPASGVLSYHKPESNWLTYYEINFHVSIYLYEFIYIYLSYFSMTSLYFDPPILGYMDTLHPPQHPPWYIDNLSLQCVTNYNMFWGRISASLLYLLPNWKSIVLDRNKEGLPIYISPLPILYIIVMK